MMNLIYAVISVFSQIIKLLGNAELQRETKRKQVLTSKAQAYDKLRKAIKARNAIGKLGSSHDIMSDDGYKRKPK